MEHLQNQKNGKMILILTILAFDIPQPPQCTIDRCEKDVCIIETPEGTVHVPKKSYYKEGMPIECSFWLIDPT